LDTNSLLALFVLVLAAAVLVVVAAAEASVAALGRGRLPPTDDDGLHARLRGYVRQRHRILRALSAASSVAVVAGTAAAVLLVLEGSELRGAAVVGVAVLAAAGAVVLRQSARMFALQSPEATGVRLGRGIRLLELGFAGVAWAGALPARLVLRLAGRDPERAEPEPAEELLACWNSAKTRPCWPKSAA